MSRYPEEARQAAIKRIGCNAPVVKTVEGSFAFVKCGDSPIASHSASNDDRSIRGDGDILTPEMDKHPAGRMIKP